MPYNVLSLVSAMRMRFCDTNNLPQSQQLTAYSSQPRVARSTNIYQYWKCSQFPLLEVAAKKYLSSPPTSVASKRLFSSAGQVYADRQNNLKGENAEKLLFFDVQHSFIRLSLLTGEQEVFSFVCSLYYCH